MSAFGADAAAVGARCGAVFVDGADDGVDADGRAFLDFDFAEGAGDGRRDFGVDLVGGDFEERFVTRDGVAGLLEPLGEGAFGDGFAHLGHDYVGRHRSASPGGDSARVEAQLGIIRRQNES